MEHRPQAEMKGRPGQMIVDSIKKWSHDNLTLQGREDKLYLKKYTQIAEKLPKDVSESQMALIELRLRQQAKSSAIGSIVIDGLVAGGALVGGAAVYGKLKDRSVAVHAQNVAGRNRVDNRSRTVFQAVKDVSYNTLKTGVDVAMFGMKVVVTPIEWGAKVVLWPIRQVGRGGAYVWGLVGGPEAVKGTATAVKEVAKIGVEAVKLPFNLINDASHAGDVAAGAVDKMAKRSADAKARRIFKKQMMDWNRDNLFKDVADRAPKPVAPTPILKK